MNRQIFNTPYPIIQAPMAGGILSPSFIASVCNHGLLGFIPAGYLTLDQLDIFISEVKHNLNSSNLSLGVNLFLEEYRNEEQLFNKPEYYLALENDLNLEYKPTFSVAKSIAEDDYINLLIKHGISIVSCTFGFLKPESVHKLKYHGIKLIGSATSLAEFQYCCNNGADAVVMQGMEAGGHQASFLSNDVNLIKTMELVKQARAINNQITLIAAGGISYSNYKDYLDNGADYVQLGTLFMMTHESNLSLKYKEFIANPNKDTELTKSITGKWARGVKNKLFNLTENHCEYSFPIQHYLTTYMRQQAKKQDNPEYSSLWAGMNKDNYITYGLQELLTKLLHNIKI